jgi:outer membrane usher protein FimD/PapC
MANLRSIVLALRKYKSNYFNKADDYIKVYINGYTEDNIQLNESFIAKKQVKDKKSYSNSFWVNHQKDNKISFNIYRSLDKKRLKRVYLSFYLKKESITDAEIQIDVFKILDKNKVLDMIIYKGNDDQNKNPFPITNLKFNQLTHEISGDFKFTQNIPSKIEITGDFKMKLMQTFR